MILNGASTIDEVSTNEEGYTIIISNELFDALPIKQYKIHKQGVKEVVVGVENGEFAFQLSPYDVFPGSDHTPKKVGGYSGGCYRIQGYDNTNDRVITGFFRWLWNSYRLWIFTSRWHFYSTRSSKA